MSGRLTDVRWMEFQNVSSSLTLPAFAPLQIVGVGLKDGDRLFVQCDQIGSAAHASFNLNIVFNGLSDVAPQGFGVCARGGDDCQCLYDTGTPAAGDVYGIKPGQSSLTKYGVGSFVVDGIVDSGTKRMYGRWEGIETVIGKVPSGNTIANGASGDINLWIGAAGSEAVTSGPWTVSAYNRLARVDENAWVEVQRINGNWYIFQDGTACVLAGTLSGDCFNATSTVTVGSLTAVTPGAAPKASTVNANNDLGLSAKSGAKVLVVGNGATWVLKEVAHTTQVVETDWEANDPNIQVKTRQLTVMANADETSLTNAATGVDCSA